MKIEIPESGSDVPDKDDSNIINDNSNDDSCNDNIPASCVRKETV
jgi:hypothetical protein